MESIAIHEPQIPSTPPVIQTLAGIGIVAVVGLIGGTVVGVAAALLSTLSCSDPGNDVYAGAAECLFYFPTVALTAYTFVYEWLISLVARSFGSFFKLYAVGYVLVVFSFACAGLGILSLFQLHVAYHGCAILGLGFLALPIAFTCRNVVVKARAHSRIAAYVVGFCEAGLVVFALMSLAGNPMPLVDVPGLALVLLAYLAVAGVLAIVATPILMAARRIRKR